MQSLSDLLIGLLLVVIVAGYFLMNQSQSTAKEAVLGEISLIMNDLEASLAKAETPGGVIPAHISLASLLKYPKSTAIFDRLGAPALMPDVLGDEEKSKGPVTLGGCPADDKHWILLRTDGAALTQIPDTWDTPTFRVCLDRNAARGPNLEGYDVIWLSFSRTGSPHITLLPADIKSLPRD